MKGFRAGMWLILGTIMVLCVAAVPAQSAVIFADNFDTEHGGAGILNFGGFTKWTISEGTVDLIGVGTIWDFYPGNGLYVDLDGSTGNAGKMTSTSFTLGSGQYQLSFFLGGNHRGAPSDTVSVSVLVGLANASYTLASGDPLAEYFLPFTVAGSVPPSNIVFKHDGGDNIGIILDQVRLIQVPEPGTMALLGSGLLGLIWGARKKKGGI